MDDIYVVLLYSQMQIPAMNKKASNSENSILGHKPAEQVKPVSDTGNTRNENLVEHGGDMEPPMEGMSSVQI